MALVNHSPTKTVPPSARYSIAPMMDWTDNGVNPL